MRRRARILPRGRILRRMIDFTGLEPGRVERTQSAQIVSKVTVGFGASPGSARAGALSRALCQRRASLNGAAARAVVEAPVPGVGAAEPPLVDERRAVGDARVSRAPNDFEEEALQLRIGLRLDQAWLADDPRFEQLDLVLGDLALGHLGIEWEDAGRHLLGREADRAP